MKNKVIEFQEFIESAKSGKRKLQIEMPEKVARLIADYQAAHRAKFGRHISKEKVVWVLISLGADELQAAIFQIQKEIEHGKAS